MAQPITAKETALTGGIATVLFPAMVILVSHFVVDVYSAVLPALLPVVESDFQLSKTALAILLGVGSICSGLAQPAFAWLSDRGNTRVYGALGLLIGALGICFIGYAPDAWTLFVVYAIATVGIGMFHPVAASTIGKLAGTRRSMAISWFFVFGMAGCFVGSLISPELATGADSLKSLAVLLVPGLLMAGVLQFSIARIEHNPVRLNETSGDTGEYHVPSIVFLYFASAARFTVNMAFIFLLAQWLKQHVEAAHPGWSEQQIADATAVLNGNHLAVMIAGMAVGGLTSGNLIAHGRERLPLILIPILFAPAIIGLSFLSPGFTAKAMCFLAGVGFASMVPVAVAVGQRLMPYHTGLASGLMLGGAWAVACVGPLLGQIVMKQCGLLLALVSTGALLAVSGLLAIGLNSDAIQRRD